MPSASHKSSGSSSGSNSGVATTWQDKLVGTLGVTVVKRDAEPLSRRIPCQIGAHDGETKYTEIRELGHYVSSVGTDARQRERYRGGL